MTPRQLKSMMQCAWEALPCLDPLRPLQLERGGNGLQYGPYDLSYDVYRGYAYVSRSPARPCDAQVLGT